MKYAHLEENTNKILGWYSGEIHSEIPTPNIEVTDETWQKAININANCYENGEFIVKDFRTAEDIESERLQELKDAKADALNTIIVITTNGNTFDGNETARGNMTAAILSAEVIGKTEDTWKLADNTSALITIDELRQALALSIQEVGRIVMVTSKDDL